MKAIVSEAVNRGITVISDEVYDRITLDGQDRPGVMTWTDDLDHIISISSVSKTYSMPGYRVGWLISSRENVEKLRRYHIYSSTVNNTSAQWAALAAFQGDQNCVAEMVGQYTRRRNRVVELLKQIPDFQSYRPDGAFYVMPSLPAGSNASAIAEQLLHDTGVCVVPGATFGQSCANAVRISFANSMENIETAFERMTDWFAQR
jgi:aminotransferase